MLGFSEENEYMAGIAGDHQRRVRSAGLPQALDVLGHGQISRSEDMICYTEDTVLKG